MIFSLHRALGYAAYFALVAPPVGGALTWMLSYVPNAIVGSIQYGWRWKTWAGLVNLLASYVIFSYMFGFFTAAITGAIYGAFTKGKSLKTQYIASFAVGLAIQGMFVLALAHRAFVADLAVNAMICFVGGASAFAMVAIANIFFGLLPTRVAQTPNPSFQRTSPDGG